jgi:hypothetical protein
MEDGLGGHLEKRHLQVDTPTNRIRSFFVFNCLVLTIFYLQEKKSKGFEGNLKSTYLVCTIIPELKIYFFKQVTSRYGTRYLRYGTTVPDNYGTKPTLCLQLYLQFSFTVFIRIFKRKQCSPKLTLALVVVDGDQFLEISCDSPFY